MFRGETVTTEVARDLLFEARCLADDDKDAGAPVCSDMRVAFAKNSLHLRGLSIAEIEMSDFLAGEQYEEMKRDLELF